jgi:hypothetical protein
MMRHGMNDIKMQMGFNILALFDTATTFDKHIGLLD